MIKDSLIYRRVEAAGSCYSLPDNTASHPKIVIFIVTAIKS